MHYVAVAIYTHVVSLLATCAYGWIEITHPKVKPVYVNSGGTLDLICELDDPYNLQWHRAVFNRTTNGRQEYDTIDTSSANGFVMTAHISGGRGWTQLKKYNVSVNDTGSYMCSRTKDSRTSYAVDVNVLQVDEIAAVVSRTGRSVTLGCVISTSERIRADIEWFKGDWRIVDDGGVNYAITHNETKSLLNITRVSDSDIGEYYCTMKLANGDRLKHVVNLNAVPRVRSMSRSQTVVAGSELELECRVWGWPVPVVTWQRLGSLGVHSRVPLNFVDDDRLSLRPGVAMAPPGVTVDNATLVISNVKYSDRDTYVCDVTSYVNGSWRTDNSTVLVRVKGKLAAVWPLLGIVLEAVVLCVIIVVHERKRARQRALADTDADNDSKDAAATNRLDNSASSTVNRRRN